MTDQQSSASALDRTASTMDWDYEDNRVLVVEDDLSTLRLLQRYLTGKGYEVLTANNAADALYIVQNEGPSVVVTDWMMPGMDGLELCRAVRKCGGAGFIYVIILTACSETDHVLEAFQAGVDDYVPKPCDLRELLGRVRVGQRIAHLIRVNSQMSQEMAKRSKDLLEAQRQVLQGEKLAPLGRLAAGVAHEINTPIQYVGDNLRALCDFFNDLTSLLAKYRDLVELVKSGKVTAGAIEDIAAAEQQECDLEFILEDAPKAIEQGLEGVERVAHIVRAMKDFSHVDREESSTIDINRALETTLTVACNEYKYVADVETDLTYLPPVECHANELNQVFLNVVVNATHAIADTGQRGKITIKTRADADHVEIAIGDTGTGIPEEIRGKIFDPFFTTREVGKGTGQGLNIAHHIVVGKHGGSLAFETEVGKGTTFTIRLPVEMQAKAELYSSGDGYE